MVRTAHGILNNSPTEVEQRRTIFGKPLGPVVRRFGLLGWTAIELARALRMLGVDFDMDELRRRGGHWEGRRRCAGCLAVRSGMRSAGKRFAGREESEGGVTIRRRQVLISLLFGRSRYNRDVVFG